MLKRFIICIIALFLFQTYAYCELEEEKKIHAKYFSVGRLYSADKEKLLLNEYWWILPKRFWSKSDSISNGLHMSKEVYFEDRRDSVKSISFNGYCWMVFASRSDENNDLYGRIIAFDEINNKIHSICDPLVSVSLRIDTIDDLYIFGDQLFLIHRYDTDDIEGKLGYEKISVIDTKNLKIAKEIILEYGSWLNKIYEKNDTLFVVVQPQKLRRNIFYEFRGIMREETMKYFFIDCGNKTRYSFDHSFNMIKKEALSEDELEK